MVKERDFAFEDVQEKSDLFTLGIRWLLLAYKKIEGLGLGDAGQSVFVCLSQWC